MSMAERHRSAPRPSRRQAGATMLEFAIGLLVFMFILGAFFDIGLAVHNWMLLRTVTAEATRESAVRLVREPICSNVPAYLRDTASVRLRKELGADAPAGKLQWTVEWYFPADYSSFPRLTVTGSFPARCFFICKFLPDINLSATTETVVETSSQTLQQSLACVSRTVSS